MHCRHFRSVGNARGRARLDRARDFKGRLSIGGGEHLPVTLNYVVVRGKIGQCIDLLEKALVALRECPE
jgi:hypothetical protein